MTPFNDTGHDGQEKMNWNMEMFFESATRITLASFGGGLVGLALERSKSQSGGVGSRRGPPILKPSLSQAKVWSLSCMMFALILETSRLSSPTSVIYKSIVEQEDDPQNFDAQLRRKGFVLVGDYTIGGAVAGLSGAMARREPPTRHKAASGSRGGGTTFNHTLRRSMVQAGRPPLVLWGLRWGMGLGFAAGLFQAASEVGEFWFSRQER